MIDQLMPGEVLVIVLGWIGIILFLSIMWRLFSSLSWDGLERHKEGGGK